jgi:hypothetical protein
MSYIISSDSTRTTMFRLSVFFSVLPVQSLIIFQISSNIHVTTGIVLRQDLDIDIKVDLR